MSYIQIEIGGKQRGLKFGQGTVMLLRDSMKDYTESEKLSHATYRLIWAALRTYSVIKEEEIDYTYADVYGWVEELSEEVLLKVQGVFNKTQEFAKDLPEDKKKVKIKTTKKAVTG